MGKSKTTFNISKTENFSEWYSEILARAEVTDIRYGVKGFVVIRPWGARIIEKMYRIYESALRRTGHDPSFFPTVIPEENFTKEAGHIEGFTPEVFWLENKQGDEKLALRPTSETAMYQMYSMWIRSHRDLPLKMYQRANVFRYETKATRPLIRGREFYWIEAHNCFATKKEAEAQVKEDIAMTEAVMHRVFGVSFLAMKRPEWDKFPGAEYTVGSDCILPDGKIIQQPSTHMLGQHFSKAFDVKYVDEKEKEKFVYQTCYGPAISRIMASVIATHGDDNGLVLPYTLAPVQVVIVPMYSKDSEQKIGKVANSLNEDFFEEQIESLVDDSDKRPGEKFFHWEMKGVPFRIEIGERELDSGEVNVFIRDMKEKVLVKLENLVEEIKNLGVEYDARLIAKAGDSFNGRISDCKDKKEIKKTLDSGKIARFNFCSVGADGKKCAEFIEKDLSARVMGIRADLNETASGKCLFCGEKAKEVVYAGKSY
ncbi:proline--tRNA ligase [archaeon]|jgi:prolyl-tRNA synthetase|nr:proline--tRNA ligase [archaeon]MBT6182386.1 proline--tRNA ligase [archaeon]MBT6606390.1 proline--tRNA ligase [archaeon]MBT7251441.1 proline--tRNA ligase [archaeon]MBT7661226.1 proline--tRNA ligase [archaeon]